MEVKRRHDDAQWLEASTYGLGDIHEDHALVGKSPVKSVGLESGNCETLREGCVAHPHGLKAV